MQTTFTNRRFLAGGLSLLGVLLCPGVTQAQEPAPDAPAGAPAAGTNLQYKFSLVAAKNAPQARADVLLTAKPEGGFMAELSTVALPEPGSLKAGAVIYVVWLYDPATQKKERVAALATQAGAGRATFDVSWPEFALVVTPEPSEHPEEWSGIAVLTGKPALPEGAAVAQALGGREDRKAAPAPEPSPEPEGPPGAPQPTPGAGEEVGEIAAGNETEQAEAPSDAGQPTEASGPVETGAVAKGAEVTTRIELEGGRRSPEARGKLEVASDGTARFTAKKLPQPVELGAGLNAFVLWAVDPANGRSRSLGALESDVEGAWSLAASGVEPGTAFVVTAEAEPQSTSRTGPVVLTGRWQED